MGTVHKHEGDEDDDETEILVENDEDEVENAVSNEGIILPLLLYIRKLNILCFFFI